VSAVPLSTYQWGSAGAAVDPVTRLTPLGVRLWDAVTQTVVTDGISLTIKDAAGSVPSARIVVNPSGVFLISNLPGLRASEAGSGLPEFWAAPPAEATFTVSVDDMLNQFLPCSFSVTAPSKGLVTLAADKKAPMPATTAPAIALFSSPARQLFGAVGGVRAQLWDVVADRPAAYATVEVDTGASPVAVGLADAQGRVLVPVPYPPLPNGLSSPPAGQAVSAQSWPVTITVHYDPETASSGTPRHPDLRTLLGQSQATALAAVSPPTAFTTGSLPFGADLVLRTAAEAALLIEPGAAP
jgi:hypothetical protein